MKTKLVSIAVLLCITGAIALSSCKHESLFVTTTDSSPSGGTQACSTDTVYFKNTVQPLLISGCAMSGCHDAASRKEGIEITSYANIMASGVRAGNPGGSKLYTVLNKSGEERMPQSPYPAFTAAQKDIIYKWILQGANNNACNSCDSTLITFAGAVSPLMNSYCKGCHNPASLGGGIDLSSYSTIKIQALNGRLIGSIAHTAGISPMPKGGSKLADCQISQVQKWILAGAQNN